MSDKLFSMMDKINFVRGTDIVFKQNLLRTLENVEKILFKVEKDQEGTAKHHSLLSATDLHIKWHQFGIQKNCEDRLIFYVILNIYDDQELYVMKF